MKKFLTIFIISFVSQIISLNSFAGSDGSVEMKKVDKTLETTSEIKDCFETVNRGIFAFNQGLDKIFLNLLLKDTDIFQNQ